MTPFNKKPLKGLIWMGWEIMNKEKYASLPTLLTRKEAQEVLKIGKSSMMKLIHDGTIPTVRINYRYKIKKEDLINFIEKNIKWKTKIMLKKLKHLTFL